MLRRILKPGVIAGFTVLLITFHSWKPVIEALSAQKPMSAGYLLRHAAVYVVEALVVYAFVYWRISLLLRDKASPLSKVLDDSSKQSQPGIVSAGPQKSAPLDGRL
jgi:hypothetical protein